MNKNSTGRPGMEGHSREREEGVQREAGVKSQGSSGPAWRLGFRGELGEIHLEEKVGQVGVWGGSLPN